MTKKIAIIGGSIAGLFCGLLLEKCGWQVDIYEKSSNELSGRGAGIITHPPLFEALNTLGINEDSIGVPLLSRKLYAQNGEVMLQKQFLQRSSSWDRLFAVLRTKVKTGSYHLNKQLVTIENGKEKVTLNFSDGTSIKADLVIGADGSRSTLRSLLFPHLSLEYSGYIAWRGMVEENQLSKLAQNQLMEGFSFCLLPNEQFLGYPVAGANDDVREGKRRFNFVWYQDANETELKRLLTDDFGQFYPEGIPPPKISKLNIAALKDHALKHLSPHLAEAVNLTQMPFFQQIYDLAVPKMAVGRVVLLGDAAFVARPHVGAGVTKAAEDAFALSQALTNNADLDMGIDAFEQIRLPIGHKIITQAKRLGANKANSALVLNETANMQFLTHDGC